MPLASAPPVASPGFHARAGRLAPPLWFAGIKIGRVFLEDLTGPESLRSREPHTPQEPHHPTGHAGRVDVVAWRLAPLTAARFP